MVMELNVEGQSKEEILEAIRGALTEWLPTQEAARAEFIYAHLGISGWGDLGLVFQDGARKRIRDPFNITLAFLDLREAMAEPGGRGAWTWARVWMDKDDLVLHTEFDWNRNCDADDISCAEELRGYPRAPEHTPTWLAQGAQRGRMTWPAYKTIEKALRAWLAHHTQATRLDIDSLALGDRREIHAHMTLTDGTTQPVTDLPDAALDKITMIAATTRHEQAHYPLGAWTRERYWIQADDKKLGSQYEWDYDPGFTSTDYAAELSQHPRSPEHTPTWLTQKATHNPH